MYIMHVAIGGCLKAPPVAYGVTDDTGGHIAYVLAAAQAQARRPEVRRIDIVTRRFCDAALDPVHDCADERVDAVTTIRRLATTTSRYLSKEALEREMPAFAAALLAYLRAADRLPDVIHAHFSDAAAAAMAARDTFGIPVVFTPHSLGFDKAASADGRVARLSRRIRAETEALARADAVIVSSRDEAERQLGQYRRVGGIVRRIPPGAPTGVEHGTASARRLLAPFLRAPDRPLVLAVARPVEKKNLRGLVDAFAATPALRRMANLAIVAGLRDGPDSGSCEQSRVIRGLIEAVDRHDLYGIVALPKRHRPSDVAQLYRLATATRGVFANPALVEPFGLTTVEAAAACLPVVVTCHGGSVDVVAELGHGVAADPRDPAAFGRAIADLLTDRARWDAASAAAAANISRYSWERYARDSLALYAQLAGERRHETVVPRPRHIVATDIDATLTGCRAGAAAFAAWAAARTDRFVVATGRALDEAVAILDEWGLPRPDAFVTAVGSEIHLPEADGRLVRAGWFDAAIAPGWWPDRIAAMAADVAGLVPQDDREQRDFKRSWFGNAAAAEALAIRLRLARLPARVVHSHGRLIDVLPQAAGKGNAVAALARFWGLGLDACIGAGDSGNDRDLLEMCGRAIVVGNAGVELAGLRPRPGLYRAAAPHAGGVMEGLRRFGIADATTRPFAAIDIPPATRPGRSTVTPMPAPVRVAARRHPAEATGSAR